MEELPRVAYSVYSYLPSLFGGDILNPNTRLRHAVVTRDLHDGGYEE
jgi:hypothetical protein